MGGIYDSKGQVQIPAPQQMRGAMLAAQGIDINSLKSVDDIARELNVSPLAVQENMYEARVELKARRIEAQQNDLLNHWAQYDEANAALARDDDTLLDLANYHFADPMSKSAETMRQSIATGDMTEQYFAAADQAEKDRLRSEITRRQTENAEAQAVDFAEIDKELFYTGTSHRPLADRIGLTTAAEQWPIMQRVMIKPLKPVFEVVTAVAGIAAFAGQLGP